MRSLPNRVNSPPGGWQFVAPETGHRIGPYNGLVQLTENIRAYYKSVGYPMPTNILALVEQQICDNNPTYCGDLEPRTFVQRAVKDVKHTFHAAVQCISTLVSHRAGTGERPALEDQERRAQVCVVCPKNQPIQKCSTCSNKQLNTMIEKIAGAKRTSVDAQLQYCEVCHCGLRAKIATMHSAIWNFMPESQKEALPETCWILTEAGDKGLL